MITATTLPSVLLAYVDESWNKPRDVIRLGAVVCDGDGALAIVEALDEIMEKVVADFKLPGDTEFHGYDLFWGEEEWVDVPIEARKQIIREAVDAITSNYETLFVRGLHIPCHDRVWPRWPSLRWVLMQLLERLNDDLHPSPVLVIADSSQYDELHRAQFKEFRKYGTPGYRNSKLERIVDTLHFAESKSSRLLQAADLMLYIYQRIKTDKNPDPRLAKFYAELEKMIFNRGKYVRAWTYCPYDEQPYISCHIRERGE